VDQLSLRFTVKQSEPYSVQEGAPVG